MFGKKPVAQIEDNKPKVKVDQDLIVHNMPHRSRFSTAPSMKRSVNSGNEFLGAPAKNPHNFKVVGGLIIGLGIIFIGTLVYLSYRFIIKPQAEPAPLTRQEPVPVESVTEPEIDLAIVDIATSTPIEGSEAGIVDLEPAETIGSENDIDILMPEEGIRSPETTWQPILDSDGDGLTDDEEIALGTNPNEIDTDQDGYLDLAEIKSGYDPSGSGRLADNKNIARYQGEVGKYTLLYPVAWNIRTLNNGYTAIISAPDNSLMQISVQENPRIQDISSWYQDTFPGEGPSYGRLKNGSGWEGIMGENGLNFYLTDQSRQNIYVISYIPAISGRLAYPNIFQMLIDSFQLN